MPRLLNVGSDVTSFRNAQPVDRDGFYAVCKAGRGLARRRAMRGRVAAGPVSLSSEFAALRAELVAARDALRERKANPGSVSAAAAAAPVPAVVTMNPPPAAPPTEAAPE